MLLPCFRFADSFFAWVWLRRLKEQRREQEAHALAHSEQLLAKRAFEHWARCFNDQRAKKVIASFELRFGMRLSDSSEFSVSDAASSSYLT